MRILLALFGLVSLFFAPAWVTLVCIVALSVRFRSWEALALGFMMDMLWLPTSPLHGMPLFTLFALGVVWILEPLRLQLLR